MAESESKAIQKKQSSTVAQQASMTTSSTTKKTTKTTTTTTKTTKGSAIRIKSSESNFMENSGKKLAIETNEKRVLSLENKADEEMQKLKQSFNIMSLEKGDSNNQLVKVDDSTIRNYMDDTGKALRFNLDVHEYHAESVSVKAVGNKIEVHARKISKKGDDEQKEEYSRTYELPSPVDVEKVTSSFFKDGVLTVELPMAALEDKK